jgi:ABC-type transport system involved in multi-copper enzyme maturation permease subunit
VDNLLSAEFFKLFRRKSFYICLAILLVLIVIFGIATKVLLESEAMPAEQLEQISMAAADMSGAKQLAATFADSDTFSLILAIFVSLFICTDYSSGTIKNTCSRGYSRFKIYLSKLVVAWFVAAVYIVLSVITRYLVYGTLFEFGTVTSGMMKEFLVICGTEMLIYMALTSIFVFISTLTKVSGIAIAVNVSLSMFVALILQLLDMFSDLNINFSNYWLVSVGAEISRFNIAEGVIIRIVMVSGVYLAVFLALGFSLFQKEDIKV